MAKAKRGRPTNASRSNPASPAGRRQGITLTPFQWWQIDSLEGIYAATVPEVLKRAVLEWLQEHHDEIEQQKRDHQKFLSETRPSTPKDVK